jgi:hypothetical protein
VDGATRTRADSGVTLLALKPVDASLGGNVGNRPLGVTILAALAGISLVLAVVHFLQALGVLPYFIGEIAIRDFNLWYAIVWALLIWAWAWVTKALWDLNPQGWLLVLLVSGFGAIFDFINMSVATQATTDLTVSFLANVVIFAYALLPGTQKAFGLKDRLPPLNP